MPYNPIDMTKKYPVEERDLARMGVGRQFWRVSLDRIPDTCAYKKMLQTWIEKMPEMMEQGVGLILRGEYRQGKTGAAVICMRATAIHGGTAYLIRADHLAGAVVERQRFDEDQTIEDRCRHVDLLVIDDMGQGGGYEQTMAMMERLIRWRYDHRRPVVTTTNKIKSIEQKYGIGTLMVLESRAQVVEVRGTPFYEMERHEVAGLFSGEAKAS